MKLDDRSGARVQRRREEEEEMKRQREEKERDPSALFIRQRDKRQARESRSPKMNIYNKVVALIVGCSLIKGIFGFNEQVMSRRFTTNLEDDVTAVYKIYTKVQGEEFL